MHLEILHRCYQQGFFGTHNTDKTQPMVWKTLQSYKNAAMHKQEIIKFYYCIMMNNANLQTEVTDYVRDLADE